MLKCENSIFWGYLCIRLGLETAWGTNASENVVDSPK